MSKGTAFWLIATFAAASAIACEREKVRKDDWKSFTPPSSSVLDGMQLDSARRVAIETAAGAMAQRNPARLRQLDKWVRGRAQVVILDPDDLEALGLAIACLEQPPHAHEILRQVDDISGGKLKAPAREVCENAAPH